MAMKSQFTSLSLSGAQKSLARILAVSALAMVCSSLAGCAVDDPTHADDPFFNRGSCIKCVGFGNTQNVYDGKTTRFEAAKPAATQSQPTQPAEDQSTSAKP